MSCGLCEGEATPSPIRETDGGLILPLAEIMDYLHFVVSIDIGDESSSITYNPIVDTASGKLMLWNYAKLTSSVFDCGCYDLEDDLGLCSTITNDEDQCSSYDYCGLYNTNCYAWLEHVSFKCDNERIYWYIDASGEAPMRFSGDKTGTYKNGNVILVSMEDSEQSDIPIHNFTDLLKYADGIIGLSYNYTGSSTTFWDLLGTGVPDTFALDFNRDCGVENRCEMHVDYVDTDTYDVQYGDPEFDREWANGETVYFHEFEMYDLLLCNTRLFGDFPTEMENVLVDTSSSCLVLHTDAFTIMTKMLSSLLTCLEVKEGRPKTCFVATKNLINLPPLRFRMKNDSSVWLNLRLENLVFGDLSGSSDLEFPNGEYYELCIQEHDSDTVFGTMALTNFYSVFDLVTQQVGLANHDETNKYTDVDSGETIVCNYGMEDEPETLTPCETDSMFCPTNAPTKEGLCSDDDECISNKEFWESHTCETASQWCEHFLWSADVQECCPLACDVCPESPTLSPIVAPENGLIIPLAQVMDYLHFVATIELGEGDDKVVVNPIVDTASGALMLWNYEGITSSIMDCGCFSSYTSRCTHTALTEVKCAEFDFCSWFHISCISSQSVVTFNCDNELIKFNMDVSGGAVMKFSADSSGEPAEGDVVLVRFEDYEQSDIPIHNFTDLMKYTDGILGLSYNYSSLGQKTTFWDMYGSVPESFALDFNRDCGVDNPCEMHIDYQNEKYDVQFGDTDYERKSYGQDVPFHEFEMHDLLLCNTRLFDTMTDQKENVLVDTGSSCLVLHTEVFGVLTTLLGPILTCMSVEEDRPKTCFVKKDDLEKLPPLRFRMHPDSDVWLNFRLENLLFGDMSGSSYEALDGDYYELCLQEDSTDTVFGTMALTNFYSVFDLVNHRVGLANHNESNDYLDIVSGEKTSCTYGEVGQPETLSPCDIDSSLCSSSPKSSSSVNVLVVLGILVAILVLCLILFFFVMRRRKMNVELIGEVEDFEIPLAPEGVSGRLGDMTSVQVNDDGIGEIAFRDLVEQKLDSQPKGESAYPPRPAGEVDDYEGTFAVADPDRGEAQEGTFVVGGTS